MSLDYYDTNDALRAYCGRKNLILTDEKEQQRRTREYEERRDKLLAMLAPLELASSDLVDYVSRAVLHSSSEVVSVMRTLFHAVPKLTRYLDRFADAHEQDDPDATELALYLAQRVGASRIPSSVFDPLREDTYSPFFFRKRFLYALADLLSLNHKLG